MRAARPIPPLGWPDFSEMRTKPRFCGFFFTRKRRWHSIAAKLQRMHAPRQLHIRSAALFLGVMALAPLTTHAAPESVALAERPKVLIVPSDVTVDGKARPDIAQALADSFSAGLLKTGDYRVFQNDVAQPKAKGKKGDLSLGSSSASHKIPTDVDLKFVFNLIGEENDYRFTLKKVRASDGEVVEVHELETHGKLDKVFGLVPNVLMKMQAKVKQKPAFPSTQSPAQVSGVIEPVMPVAPRVPLAFTSNGTGSPAVTVSAYGTVPDEYANIDFSKVPKALIYQQVGSVQFINEAWKFCIIRPQSDVKLKMSDALHVLYDEDGRIYADLKIANFDSGRVIADFGNRTPIYHKIFPGDEVFGWAPPAK